MSTNSPLSLDRDKDIQQHPPPSVTLKEREEKEATQDVPPDGGYGWVCVACTFTINAHTWGVNSAYAIFLSYYLSHNYFPNTSPLAYAFVGGLSISQALFIAPLGTRVVHDYGTRVCLYLGVVFETLSLIGASFATKKWQLILSQGICFGWGMGFLFVGSVGVPAQWFLKKRSLANAFAASGSGCGGLIYALATQRMIETLGLPWTFRVLGIVSCIVNLTASSLLRDRNKAVGARHKALDSKLLKRPEFLLLQAWSFFSVMGYVVVLFSLPSYAVSIGLSANQGSIVGAVLSLGQMVGRPITGLLSDRYGRLNIASLFTFACALFCFAFWIPAKGLGLLCFFALVGGAFAGTVWCTIAPVSAEVVGLRDLPAGLSLTWVMMIPPTTLAEPIALELRRSGSSNVYIGAQVFTGMMYIAAALSLWFVRGWKVGELDDLATKLEAEGVQNEAVKETEKMAAVDDGQVERSVTVATSRKGRWVSRDMARRMWAWKCI